MPTVRRDGIEIFYHEAGEGDPVVLVGGLTSTAEVWGMQVPALSARHRVITPDNRGSGRTEVEGDDGTRSLESFAADVRRLIEGLELEPVHLVGASMGGMIVQETALRYPDLLRTLTIACSHPGGEHAVHASREVIDKLMAGGGESDSGEERLANLSVTVHPRSLEKRRDRVDFYAATKAAYPHAREELDARITGIGNFSTWDRLPELRLPTLVITGADDEVVPPENSRRLAERIPNAELATIPEAGHIFFIEHPTETNQALLEFFARH